MDLQPHTVSETMKKSAGIALFVMPCLKSGRTQDFRRRKMRRLAYIAAAIVIVGLAIALYFAITG